MKHVVVTGQKFGSWEVLDAVSGKMLPCRCVCGLEKLVSRGNLTMGKTTSCGCTMAGRPKTHGLSKHPMYQLWKGMKARCYQVSHKNYADYGGRGITVCDRWKESFEDFLADMGDRPSLQHSLDREDTNGNYEKSNCKWSTQTEQTRNTRRSKLIEINGETKTVAEWADITGLKSSTIYHRLAAGDSPETALRGMQ